MAPETSAPATNDELRVQQAEIHAGPFAHVSDQARLEAAAAMRSVMGICGATGGSASETGGSRGDSQPTLEHYELRNELRYEKDIRNALRAS